MTIEEQRNAIIEPEDCSACETGVWQGELCAICNGTGKAARNQSNNVPVAWRYVDARGHYRYRSYVPNFDKEYKLLKPIPLYTSPQHSNALEKEEIISLQQCRVAWLEVWETLVKHNPDITNQLGSAKDLAIKEIKALIQPESDGK